MLFRSCFSPKGDIMAAAFENGMIQAWDVKAGMSCLPIKAHEDEVQSVAFSHSGSYLASASDDETVSIWNVRDGSCSLKLSGHAKLARVVLFSADDISIYSASEDGVIRIWSAETGEVRQELGIDDEFTGLQSMTCFADPDCLLLASGYDDGWICIWNIKDGKAKVSILAHATCITAVIFALDGEVLASAGICVG